ncbi:hypothetical protein FACS189483_05170 [Spirochaetia bacterium]|nr:hypothetical protein FACS189483_05170 [Spirochaetia bacterium]
MKKQAPITNVKQEQKPTETVAKTIKIPINEHPKVERIQPAIMKAEKEIKVEVTKQRKDTPKTVVPEIVINKPSTDTALIIKSGTTDLRRGAKQLATDSKTKMGNPHDGNIRAYANRFKTTVKLVQEKPEGTTLVTMNYNKPVEWPEYQPPEKPGHTIALNGKEKDAFLEERNCPKSL